MKIFVSAYACEPGLGSEIGVGWHWILQMSRFADLWVLTRESNRHTIEPWINSHPEYAKIHFLYYDWPKWARFWKKGLRGVRTYYNLWQFSVNRIVRRTMRNNDIHIFHHITYGNVLWKVSGFGSKQTFVWGPVGGLETIPKEFTSHYSRRSRLIESVRRAVVRLLPLNAGFKKRCRCADLILCKTEVTRDLIPAKYRHKAVLQTDVATEAVTSGAPGLQPGDADSSICDIDRSTRVRVANPAPLCNVLMPGLQTQAPYANPHTLCNVLMPGLKTQAPYANPDSLCNVLMPGLKTQAPYANPNPQNFITVGRLDAWRGFDLAIEALAESGLPDATLTIVGKGEDRPRLEALARSKGVADRVIFTGKVDMDEYRRLMREADAVVNASLKEGAVTVSFDAMSLGKPLVCVDTTGYTRYFTDDYAVTVPIGSRKDVITGIAEGLRKTADPETRRKMGEAAIAAAKCFTWSHRGEEIKNLYNKLV